MHNDGHFDESVAAWSFQDRWSSAFARRREGRRSQSPSATCTRHASPMTSRLSISCSNTINNLTSQEAQVACFQNAAAHLEPGGLFLIEVGVPPLQRLSKGETLLAFDRSDTHWGIDEFDVVTQNFTSHHVRMRGQRLERFSIPFRYVWPAELDLMARLPGLRLKERWSGWQREPFTRLSDSHVSVWQKEAA
jgi:hypothetical protein